MGILGTIIAGAAGGLAVLIACVVLYLLGDE